MCGYLVMSRSALQEGKRENEEHHRRKNTEHGRYPRSIVRASDAEKCWHHHDEKDEPENTQNHAVLSGEDRASAFIKLGELGQETAILEKL